MFAELGAVVIDTDVIAREVVMPGKPALDEIIEANLAPNIVDDERCARSAANVAHDHVSPIPRLRRERLEAIRPSTHPRC